jgi:hypothetical protein
MRGGGPLGARRKLPRRSPPRARRASRTARCLTSRSEPRQTAGESPSFRMMWVLRELRTT